MILVVAGKHWKMKSNLFLSICIPSYNRPDELVRLLKSVNCSKKNESKIEIVIAEDKAPKRNEVITKFNEFVDNKNNDIDCKLLLNDTNYGYDANLRNLIHNSSGEYIVFMGDDDVFTEGALDKLIDFLEENNELGYVLRSYQTKHINGEVEKFKYFKKDTFFDPGIDTVKDLFRKSVFISGFTFKRECVINDQTDVFDSTLLYQIYLVSIICMKYKSAYFDYPITMSIDSNNKTAYFGSSEKEKSLYKPKIRTIENSINFINSYFKITKYFDKIHDANLTEYVKKDMNKYSYPILSFQRRNGIIYFTKYMIELKKIGLGNTIFFYIYYFGLLVFGEKLCDNLISFIKNKLSCTPKL